LALRDAWDEKVAAEKAQKAAEERARVIKLTGEIAAIRSMLTLAQSARTAARVEALLDKLIADWANATDFQEFAGEALEAYNATHAGITALMETKRAEEVEAARVKLEAEAAAKKVKDDREANEAAAAKLAEERAAFEAEKAALKAALAPVDLSESVIDPLPFIAPMQADTSALQDDGQSLATVYPAPVTQAQAEVVVLSGVFTRTALNLAKVTKRPTDTELLDGLADHFCVSDLTALSWLLSVDLKALQAEFAGEAA
jgi:hypothetical protein